MKLLKIAGVATAVTGLAAVIVVAAPVVFGQSSQPGPFPDGRRIDMFGVAGSSIGASIRDVDETDPQRTGVFVEAIEPGSAAEKGGLKKADIITRFAGESEARGNSAASSRKHHPAARFQRRFNAMESRRS